MCRTGVKPTSQVDRMLLLTIQSAEMVSQLGKLLEILICGTVGVAQNPMYVPTRRDTPRRIPKWVVCKVQSWYCTGRHSEISVVFNNFPSYTPLWRLLNDNLNN